MTRDLPDEGFYAIRCSYKSYSRASRVSVGTETVRTVGQLVYVTDAPVHKISKTFALVLYDDGSTGLLTRNDINCFAKKVS